MSQVQGIQCSCYVAFHQTSQNYMWNLGDLIFFFLKIPFDKIERAKLKMLFDKNSPIKLKSWLWSLTEKGQGTSVGPRCRFTMAPSFCMPIWCFWLLQCCVDSTENLTFPSNLSTHTIELSTKSPCFWATFHPQTPLSIVSAK